MVDTGPFNKHPKHALFTSLSLSLSLPTVTRTAHLQIVYISKTYGLWLVCWPLNGTTRTYPKKNSNDCMLKKQHEDGSLPGMVCERQRFHDGTHGHNIRKDCTTSEALHQLCCMEPLRGFRRCSHHSWTHHSWSNTSCDLKPVECWKPHSFCFKYKVRSNLIIFHVKPPWDLNL